MSTIKRRVARTLAVTALAIAGAGSMATAAQAQCNAYGNTDVCIGKSGAIFEGSYFTYHQSAMNDSGRLWIQQCRGDRTNCVRWTNYTYFTAPNYQPGYFYTDAVYGSFGHIYRTVVEGQDRNGGYVRVSPFVAY